MNVLALETSARVGSVALRQAGGGAADHVELDERCGHARGLAPAISALLRRNGLRATDLHAIVVGLGPGAYTGIRLALATAKTMAVFLDVPIVGVPSTAVLAAHEVAPAGDVLVVLDARKGDVYAARYRKHAEGRAPLELEAPAVRRAAELAGAIGDAFVLGDGWSVLSDAAGRVLPGTADAAPRATDLLAIGLEHLDRGERHDPHALVPLYLRRSEAEINWERRRAASTGGST